MKIAAAILLASQFEKDELVNLTYMFWMNGAENDIEISTAAACDAFTEKYGRPDIGDGRHACTWIRSGKSGQTAQMLAVSTQNMKIGKSVAVFVSIALFRTATSEDI